MTSPVDYTHAFPIEHLFGRSIFTVGWLEFREKVGIASSKI